MNPIKSSAEGEYSCASCHHAQGGFQACLPQGIGEGGMGFGHHGEKRRKNPHYNLTEVDVQAIRTPSVLNVAFQTNMLWNGQFGANGVNKGTWSSWMRGTPRETNYLGFDGVETQAIAAMDVHRLEAKEYPLQDYIPLFQKAFPDVLEKQQVSSLNAALAIAAYERTLMTQQAPFQKWLAGEEVSMTIEEKKGAILFFGKAACSNCHTGPALNSMEFHALGMHDLHIGAAGRVVAVSDTAVEHKGRGGFTNDPEDLYKFKVPQLYNLKDSPFYGHGASFRSIRDVITYKNNGISENKKIGKKQLSPYFQPLGLTEQEINQIAQFIETGLYDPHLERYVPSELPSGNCFPNNDRVSNQDQRCSKGTETLKTEG